MYAVIDTETTGLLPSHRHRVIEVAVVLLDARGQVEHEWVTLLNPQRDLGPQHIHGILTADVLAAPEFADVARPLGELLAGRMVVGHNVEFDLGFLRAEFARLGVAVPLITERSMCTMALAGYLYPVRSGRSARVVRRRGSRSRDGIRRWPTHGPRPSCSAGI